MFGPGLQIPPPVGQARRQDDLQDIFPRHPGGRVEPGQQLQPELDVLGGVAHHQGPLGGPGGGLDADDVPQGHGEQAVGVVFREVLPGGERQPGEIAQTADGVQAHSQAVELLAVEFHLAVSPGQGALEALQLQQFQLLPVHGLEFRLAHVSSSSSSQ